MSELIPWEQVTPPKAMKANSNETVRDVRDRLRDLGGHAQFNVPILIELSDGHVAPTSAPMLRKLAQEKGASILKFTLDDLLMALCPEPWSVESRGPAYLEAEQAAARRKLPVVATQEGQPVGLMPPPGRHALFVTRSEGAFDLFDDPLSRDDLSGSEFVTATLDETVAQVVEKLKALHDPDQGHVVVKVDEGSFQLMNRNLATEIEHFVTDVWPAPLRQFEANLRPTETRQLDDLGREQAQALTQRRSLVLLDNDGQVAGLMLSGQRQHAVPQVGFDLFDEPLSNFELSQTELPEPEVVWARLDTLLARVARDLQELQDATRACVAVEKDDGSFGLIATWELNQRLRRLGEQALGLRLREIVPDLPPIESRAFDIVGRKQIQVLLEQKKHLLLTSEGQWPPTLLSEKAAPPTFRDRREFDICNVTQTTIDSYLPRKQMVMEPRRPSPRGAQAMAAQPQADQQPRYVNLWFEQPQSKPEPTPAWQGQQPQPTLLAKERPLIHGQTYQLRVNIGAHEAKSIVDWEDRPLSIVEPPEIKEQKEAKLYVSAFSQDFEIEEPTQILTLPPGGNSDTVQPVQFKVRPVRRTFGTQNLATLDVCLYYRCNLVQSFQVTAEVLAEGEKPRSKAPQRAVLKAARVDEYPDLDEIAAKELNLTINKRADGAYQFTFTLTPEATADPRWEAIRLGCHVELRREDLIHLITKTRRQLYNITRLEPFHTASAIKEPTRRKVLSALALLGRQLYSRLFELGGPDTSARQIAAWIKDEKNLPEGSTIQVIDRTGDFVFPWSLVYDEIPWDQDGLPRKAALDGFWGYRYRIELLTEDLLQTYQASGVEVEVDVDSGLQVGVGLNEQIPWSQAQRGFFNELDDQCAERAGYHFFDTSTALTQFLKNGNRHIFYVFCHGFTERMATDIQIGDDLIGEFKSWLNTIPDEQRQDFKDQAETLFEVSDSWIKLTYGTVPLTMMEHFAAPRFNYAPLVFLNMCQSAQVLPSLSGGFIPFFLKRGARMVIGTECPMTSAFADPFAREFFQRLLQGQKIGSVLWELRREFLDQGNPLGLAYTMYGDANCQLSETILKSND